MLKTWEDSSSSIKVSDAVAVTSLTAVFMLACFNAGYFSRVGSRFIDLFSIPDLFSASIPILQYFVFVYFLYSTAGLLLVFVPDRWKYLVRARFDDFLSVQLIHGSLAWLLLCIGLGFLAWGLSGALEETSFTLAVLPIGLMQAFFLYVGWIERRNGDPSLQRGFIISGAVAAIMFAYNSGRLWAVSDFTDQRNVSAFIMDNGQCYHRILLRTNSSGYLLYNSSMKQVEFRSKEQVRSIFPGSSCL